MRRRCRLRAGLVLLLSTLAGGCASGGKPRVTHIPRPFPTPAGDSQPRTQPPTAQPAPPETAADFEGVVQTALALRGAPYRNGGADEHGFDCSGFTQYVFAENGVALPRAVRDQFQQGNPVSGEEVVAGDLLFFATDRSVAPSPSHVGIAIGGGEFVHAPSSKGVVRVDRLESTYWSARYVGARRPFAVIEP